MYPNRFTTQTPIIASAAMLAGYLADCDWMERVMGNRRSPNLDALDAREAQEAERYRTLYAEWQRERGYTQEDEEALEFFCARQEARDNGWRLFWACKGAACYMAATDRAHAIERLLACGFVGEETRFTIYEVNLDGIPLHEIAARESAAAVKGAAA